LLLGEQACGEGLRGVRGRGAVRALPRAGADGDAPGSPLSPAYGFEMIEEGDRALTDGVTLEYASMTKSLNGTV